MAVDSKNNVLFAAGDAEYPVFMRATVNPFISVPVIESGAVDKFKLNDEELALICATHNGETYHAEIVMNILTKLDLKIEHLQCGVHPPLDRASYEQLIIKGRRPTALHNASSGKHAGLLAMAKALNEPVENYASVHHPVQQKLIEKIKAYAEKDRIPTALGDSNLPTYFLPLRNIAIMYRKLIEGTDDQLQRVFHIMSLHPRLIAGKGRFDSEFIATMNGRGIAKIGAEGVRAAGIRTEDGQYIGIVVKALSGNKQAADSMAIAVMRHLKLMDDETVEKLKSLYTPEIRNHNDMVTGHIETEIVIE